MIGSSPTTGSLVESGTSVNLEVSSRPARVAVPEVVGKTQAEAEAALKSVGLLPGKITTTSHPELTFTVTDGSKEPKAKSKDLTLESK